METAAVIGVIGAVSGKGGAALRQSSVCAEATALERLSATSRKRSIC
jgi:hypothetical protein